MHLPVAACTLTSWRLWWCTHPVPFPRHHQRGHQLAALVAGHHEVLAGACLHGRAAGRVVAPGQARPAQSAPLLLGGRLRLEQAALAELGALRPQTPELGDQHCRGRTER